MVQVAPAVRVALGEEFGLRPGTNVKGKMFAALRRLGFDKAYDTEFAADLTIMEEGTELIHRIFGALGLKVMKIMVPYLNLHPAVLPG